MTVVSTGDADAVDCKKCRSLLDILADSNSYWGTETGRLRRWAHGTQHVGTGKLKSGKPGNAHLVMAPEGSTPEGIRPLCGSKTKLDAYRPVADAPEGLEAINCGNCRREFSRLPKLDDQGIPCFAKPDVDASDYQ